MLRHRRVLGQELREGAEQILELDPLSFRARYYQARGRVMESDRASWSEVIAAISRCPALLTDVARLIASVQSAPKMFDARVVPLVERARGERDAYREEVRVALPQSAKAIESDLASPGVQIGERTPGDKG